MADAGAVERVAVPPGIEANEVERNGGKDVLQVGLLEAEVAGTSHPGDRDGLVDGPLDTRAGSVLGSPLLVALLEAGMVEDFLHLAGLQGEGPAAGLRAGAVVAHRAGAACLLVELDDDGLGAAQGGGAPPGAGVSAWAGACRLS